MEWVEVRGETLEAAKEEALDQLGVALDDAEFEVVQEPESRWMGLRKTEARVRARVRPTQPRPKRDGRNNRRQRRGNGGGGDNRQRQGRGGGGRNRGGRGGQQRDGEGQRKQGDRQQGQNRGQKQSGGQGRNSQKQGQNTSEPRDAATDEAAAPAQDKKSGNSQGSRKAVSEQNNSEPMPQAEQEQAVVEFLDGLVAGFGLEATSSTSMEDDIMIGSVDGGDLGLMIGPKGGTMRAIQELTRAAVQRRSDGRDTARTMVDVAGYRERRRAALAEFAGKQADVVKADGVELALEPMSSADRKAVHDAIMDIEGVRSISEGDEPRRRVVLLPED